MVQKCPSCKAVHGFKECANCGKSKFQGSQCMVCGHTFFGDDIKCDGCGTLGLKLKTAGYFDFDNHNDRRSLNDLFVTT